MWSVEYVQVPKETTTAFKEASDMTKDDSTFSSTHPQASSVRRISHHGSVESYSGRRKLSRHESCDSYSDGKPAADMLKDFKDPDYLATMECDLGSSEERDSPLATRMREEDRDIWDKKGLFGTVMSSTSSAGDLYHVTDDIGSVGEGVEAERQSIKSGNFIDTAADALVELGGEAKKDASSVGVPDAVFDNNTGDHSVSEVGRACVHFLLCSVILTSLVSHVRMCHPPLPILPSPFICLPPICLSLPPHHLCM